MTRPRLLFYCQHAVGVGHFKRAMALATGLARHYEVTLVSGGPAIADATTCVRIEQLPPMWLDESGALCAEPGEDLASIQRARRRRLVQLFDELRPRVLMTELFPFGRKRFAFELQPLLVHAGRESLVLCSLRDILGMEANDHEARMQQACSIANAHFDGILVHGDPRLDLEHLDRDPRLDVPLRFTGYVHAGGTTTTPPSRREPGRVIVSVGGGRVGAELIDAAIDAYQLHGIGAGRTMTLVLGMWFPQERLASIQAAVAGVEGLELVRWFDSLPDALAGAGASVSQCGYNTAMDVLAWGGPALMIPHDSQEQRARVRSLAAKGKVRALEPEALSGERLAAELRELFSFQPSAMALDMAGVDNSAALVVEFDQRRERRSPIVVEAPRRKRVCFLSLEFPPNLGGVGKSAARVVDLLVAANYDVCVLTRAEVDTITRGHERGAWVVRIPGLATFGVDLLAEVQALHALAPFDLFHSFFVPMAYPCLPLIAAGAWPLLVSVRGSDAGKYLEDPYLRSLVAAVLKQADHVTSVASDLLDNVASLIPSATPRTLIVNPAIEAGPRWRLTPANAGVVGTVSEFRKKKNTALLVEAYAALPSQVRHRLLLIGYFSDPEYEHAHHRRVERLGLGDEVELTAKLERSEVLARLPDMRVFVQPSSEDGLPNALLEAAAAGIPIVSTNVGGMRDVLVDGKNALLVESNDRVGLTRAIARVLSDDDLAMQLSDGARSLLQTCSPRREADEWLRIYAEILAEPGGLP